MSDPVLLIEDLGQVRLITLNRPDKLNALNLELTKALCDTLEAANTDNGVRSIVLAGTGRAFCAGADTTEFKVLHPDNAGLVEQRSRLTMRLQSLPRIMAKPVVAAVQGIALGGGAGLALACDMLVVTEDLQFGYPELRHGLVPALVMTNLAQHLGPKIAFELISTGRRLSGVELADFHLANRVTSREALMPEVLKLAAALAALSVEALGEAKNLLYRVMDMSFADAMEAGRRSNIRMRSFGQGDNQ